MVYHILRTSDVVGLTVIPAVQVDNALLDLYDMHNLRKSVDEAGGLSCSVPR
jgi:hypothetical protein